MKKSTVRSLLAITIIALATSFAFAQSSAVKTLQGRVLGVDDAPLSGAIVYLQDGKTNSIRSFFSTANGSYRFGQLSSDTDYQVWAKYKNEKSGTRTISSYDSRKNLVIDLHIKAK
jgi:Carboxypeptidase regulatory-like domain